MPPSPSRALVRPAAPVPRSALVVSAVQAAAAAAGWGLLVVALVVLLLWAVTPEITVGGLDAVRTAGQLWLAAHRVPLDTTAGVIALAPLGLTAGLVGLLARAGARVVRTVATGQQQVLAVIGVGTAYSLITAAVAGLAETSLAQPHPVAAVLAGFVLGVVGAGAGAAAVARPVLPVAVGAVLRAGAAALAVLVAVGAVLVGVGLALQAGSAAVTFGEVAPTAQGAVGVLLLGLVLVPTAVVWGAAYVVGTGFSLGAGTVVAPYAVHLGAVPAFPLLAGLPAPGGAPGPGLVLVVVGPLAAGVLAARLVHRRGGPLPRGSAVLRAAACGPVAGLGLGALALLASGSLGSDRLTVVGPSAWQVSLAAAAEVAAVAAAAAAWSSRTRGRGAQPAAAATDLPAGEESLTESMVSRG